ncbi:MAG: peptidase C39 family protein [Pseudomonas sp.]|uniref:peptidase C39 family protein n=1 Tax=Pseudomonas TaxID=286 RepID=UPI0011B41522|nr:MULTISPECIES: peptidase C39 family protein [Pseudomonas]MDN5391410.1 peptidase C39 family protein [Pseudomonas sp.]MDN5455075.1 peptidase C39 family protein [Pseudomonas sp.]MDN5457200.1 peptidase C39 family protein [Pseudomonas sp.]
MRAVTGAKSARLWLMGVFALAMVGCASVEPPEFRRLPERVELNGVPFFRGNANQGAPQILAGMLSEQRVRITPGLLVKPLQLPGAEASLQSNIEQLAAGYGLMVYPLDKSLSALLTQVAAGYPVMLRFSDGTLWSEPRYAMLVGYNRAKGTVLLRAGMERRRLMDFSTFESAWKDAGGWAVLILSPAQLPANVDKARWLKIANELSRSGQEQAGAAAIKTLESHR